MKRRPIQVLLLIISMIGNACNGGSSIEAPTTSALPSPTATTTPDENGNEINADGWPLLAPLAAPAKKKKSTKEGFYQDGRKVKVNVVSYYTLTDKGQRTIIFGPHRPGEKASVITGVEELSVRGGKIYCYIYRYSPYADEGRGNSIGVTGWYKYCDMDGDGKFEVRGYYGTNLVPDWAK